MLGNARHSARSTVSFDALQVPPDFAQKRFHISTGRDYYKQFLAVGGLGITVMAFDFDSIVYENV